MKLTEIIDDVILHGNFTLDELERWEEGLIALWGWQAVYEQLVTILEDNDRVPNDWSWAVSCIWGLILDEKPLQNKDRLIALMYHRLPEIADDENTIWSITMCLKKKKYLSYYEPLLDDEGVIRELEKFKLEKLGTKNNDGQKV